mmetsp:Transcript_17460/g.21315  ORF Transcript_17460/g.21315 Transcript_17460/m.21315 type:complete len:99 (-) Transcript_17460:371-667(-)
MNLIDEENEQNYTKDYCESIVKSISRNNEAIPVECNQYEIIREELISSDSKHDHAIAFEGMNCGQALSAMAARDRSHLNPNQIQRRYTNRNSDSRRVW